MAQTQPTALSLDQISLRKAERGFLCGGTETGKSTLADRLGLEFLYRYRNQKARRFLADTKPRYHAQWTFSGTSAKRRYKDWDHGPTVPDSVVVDDPDDMHSVWNMGYSTVIMQCASRRDIPRIVAGMRIFLDQSRANRPQLLQIDETRNFFHPNGSPIGGDDVVVRAANAGRERGTACLFCSQRTKAIPPELMEEMKRLYAFRLDYKADAKRFQEMGAPPFALPTKEHQFVYWYKADYGRTHGPYILSI